MQIELKYRSANTIAKLTFKPGDEITTESGSMVAMSDQFDLETTTHQKNGQGGIIKGLKRMFSGESFFLNHYTARADGELWLSSTLPGDMNIIHLTGEGIVVQSGSFVACEKKINMDLGWQGFKSIFSGENLFWLNINGEGACIISSFGSIYEKEIDGEYIVDTGHIVAFEETLKFKISKAGSSWLHSFMGGEGLVCRFEGKGKIWCQSHNEKDYGNTLRPHLKVKRR